MFVIHNRMQVKTTFMKIRPQLLLLLLFNVFVNGPICRHDMTNRGRYA